MVQVSVRAVQLACSGVTPRLRAVQLACIAVTPRGVTMSWWRHLFLISLCSAYSAAQIRSSGVKGFLVDPSSCHTR